MPANPARGEVELKLGGETYVLVGEFERLAHFQSALGLRGLANLLAAVAMMDASALYHGVRTLAKSGDVEKLRALHLNNDMLAAIQAALTEAISGPDEGNGDGGAGSRSPASSPPAAG